MYISTETKILDNFGFTDIVEYLYECDGSIHIDATYNNTRYNDVTLVGIANDRLWGNHRYMLEIHHRLDYEAVS